jgi:uncharacterized protein YndB with AHSA1/START domain
VKRDLHFDELYPYPIETVWRAITTSDAIAQWLMPNDFVARVGHEFQFRSNPQPGWDGIVNCKVLELDEPHRVAFSWRGGPLDTVVTITLERMADGTRLLLDHAGFAGEVALSVASILENGWRSHILSRGLPAVLARMAAEDNTPVNAKGSGE